MSPKNHFPYHLLPCIFHMTSFHFKFIEGRGQKLYNSAGSFYKECLLGALQFLIMCCHINQVDIKTATLTFVS